MCVVFELLLGALGGVLEALNTAREMVGAFTKLSCDRPSNRPKHHHFLDGRIGWSRISPAASLHGVPPLEIFEAVEHPSEPVDVDQPARCPPPERSILRDGLIWREMLAETLRRQSQRAPQIWQGEVAGSTGAPPRRRTQRSPREKYMFITHSAPERIVTRMLEESA
ncbi:uncharacterized protein [Physcomitrium patens]|uniref:Uncharacterized protein n=2 Tax=Physcomitrium patens TaxID=3218 RepID=A0A2K1IYV7_PHYPA|nr:uncharacterized protein LOC112295853 isoform X1 [Physcomitrium patens]PNR34462.1 hypothetical protein PHYPA_024279 [Physcomitrium patens]|eukprot:XP_024403625.1 uncharacterized protein LOC112295853 isoform X1 [Physcomitrella patens]